MYCSSCGTNNIETANFCQNCGGKLNSIPKNLSKNKLEELGNLDKKKEKYEFTKAVQGVRGSRIELYDYRVRLKPEKYDIGRTPGDYLIGDIIAVDLKYPRFKSKKQYGYLTFRVRGINEPQSGGIMTLGGNGVNIGMYGGGKKPLLSIYFSKEWETDFIEMKNEIESKISKYH